MIKKLTKRGEELALVLDEAMLAQLGIDENTDLDVTVEAGVLKISAHADSRRKQQFQDALEETNRRFGRALRRLAE